MDNIEKIKKQFEQGNRWVEANTDDIKQALSELGYRLLKELPTTKDVFPAGGVPDEWAKAIEYYRAYLIGCGITQAKHPPGDKREAVVAALVDKCPWADSCKLQCTPADHENCYGQTVDTVLPLISPPMEVLNDEEIIDLVTEYHFSGVQNRHILAKKVSQATVDKNTLKEME